MSNRLLFSGLKSAFAPELLPSRPHLAFDTLRAVWRRHRSRRRIAQLDARMLKDIGIGYAEAEAEANKPFWRS